MKPGRHFSTTIVWLLCVIPAAGLTACSNSGSNISSAVTAVTANSDSSVSVAAASAMGVGAKQMVYIKSFDADSGALVVDPIEWIAKGDTERIRELKLSSAEDFPNGYYIYNPSQQTETMKLSRNADLFVLKWNSVGVAVDSQRVGPEQFAQRLKQDDSFYPYWLAVNDGEISVLQEQYVP